MKRSKRLNEWAESCADDDEAGAANALQGMSLLAELLEEIVEKLGLIADQTSNLPEGG